MYHFSDDNIPLNRTDFKRKKMFVDIIIIQLFVPVSRTHLPTCCAGHHPEFALMTEPLMDSGVKSDYA